MARTTRQSTAKAAAAAAAAKVAASSVVSGPSPSDSPPASPENVDVGASQARALTVSSGAPSSSPLSAPPDENDPLYDENAARSSGGDPESPSHRPARGARGRRPLSAAVTSSPELEDNNGLHPITLPSSSATKNLNAWNAVKHDLSVTVDITPTQAPRVPLSWRISDTYDGRAYEVVEVIPVNSYRRRRAPNSNFVRTDAQGNYIEEAVVAWEITVQDTNRPTSDLIRLYTAHDPSRLGAKVEVRGGVLERRFCNRDAAHRVGRQACDRLNRLPMPVSPDTWNQPVPPVVKLFLEVESMSAISPDFDHSLIDPIWRTGQATHLGIYGFAARDLTIESRPGNEADRWSCSTYDFTGVRFKINFKPGLLDVEKVLEELRDKVPQSLYYRAAGTKEARSKLTDEQHDAGLVMMRYLQHSLWGCNLSRENINTWVRRQIEAYAAPIGDRVQKQMKYGSQGPCDGKAGWTARPIGRGFHIKPLPHLAACVTGGELPTIKLLQKDEAALAHVQQVMFLSLSAGDGLLNAWQAGCIAADIINGFMPDLIDTERLIAGHCVCHGDEDRQNNSHYCMHCSRFVRCCDGAKLEDGRFVCRECVPSGAVLVPRYTGSTLRDLIRTSCWNVTKYDCQVRGVAFSRQQFTALVAHCHSFILNRREGTWQDAWNGVRKFADATYRDVNLRHLHGLHRLVPHFLQPSPEHVLPYININDELWIHAFQNVVLATYAENLMRGPHIPSVLYLMRLAREHWLAEQRGQAPDEQFWAAFYIAMDHAMMIRKMAPYRASTRVFQKFSTEKFEAISACYKSGEFVGSTGLYPFNVGSNFLGHEESRRKHQPTYADAYADWVARGGRREWDIWNDDDWADILFILGQIQSSPIYNPKNYSIPLGPGGYPFIFLLAHMPDKSTPQDFRDFICREMMFHWRRLDESCNLAWITGGSPKTLFLMCLVLWFATRGRDEMFGCGLTFYTTHMLTFSIGRRAEVDPGSAAHDGWTTENPKSLADYDPEKRTLTIQAASVNRFCAAFPKEYLPQLPELVLSNIRRATSYYDATKMDMSPINLPKNVAVFGGQGHFTRDLPPWDDFVGLWQNRDRDNDDISLTGQEGQEATPPSLATELALFERRVERGERLEFNQPALAILERTRDTNADGDNVEPMRRMVNGVCAAWIIPLAKVGRDGDQAYTHDDMNTWLVKQATQDSTPPGVVVFSAAANGWMLAIESAEDPENDIDFTQIGNPFSDTAADRMLGGVTKAVMIFCNAAHFVVLAFYFDAVTATGRIEYWNSSQSVGDEETSNYRRVSRWAPIFGRFLARQPQVSLPNLDWDGHVNVMAQTRQREDTNIDCGPLAINAQIHAAHGTPPEVHTDRHRDKFVNDLRYRYLSWGFEAYMGVPSMTDYIEEHFDEDAARQRREREAQREKEAEEERARLEAEERARREAEGEGDGSGSGQGGDSGTQGETSGNTATVGLSGINTRLAKIEQDVLNVNARLTRLDDNQLHNFNRLDATMKDNLKSIERQLKEVVRGAGSGSSSSRRTIRTSVIPRQRFDRRVLGAVDASHPAYRYAVVAVQGNTRQFGYPGFRAFYTVDDEELATFDDSGNIMDTNTGDVIGNFMEDGEV